MNIYDFDNTIFEGDSSVKFIKYSLIRHPLLVLLSIFKAIGIAIIKRNKTAIKGALFSFVKHIKNFDEYMDLYVTRKMKYIKEFYLEQYKEDDVIISASYDFIIERFCKKLNIKNVICSKYDVNKGIPIGKNCKGKEKVNRFNELFSNKEVINAYSDSLSDIPMLKLAKHAYIVKGRKIIPYYE